MLTVVRWTLCVWSSEETFRTTLLRNVFPQKVPLGISLYKGRRDVSSESSLVFSGPRIPQVRASSKLHQRWFLYFTRDEETFLAPASKCPYLLYAHRVSFFAVSPTKPTKPMNESLNESLNDEKTFRAHRVSFFCFLLWFLLASPLLTDRTC